MLTAYDAPTAELLENAGVDIILVGDSLGMVILGYPSTAQVTMDEMIHHAKAVRRGAPKSCVIGDMPLKGVEKGVAQALSSARRFVKEAGCDGVKIEWHGQQTLDIVNTLLAHQIPVMGHLGLTPQTVAKKNGFRVQAKDSKSALQVFQAARDLEKHKAFAVLLECVPKQVAAIITRDLKVPVIGIGAGPYCDGQVLVFQDVVGLFKKFTPRFVKRYAQIDISMRKAVDKFIKEVQQQQFPQARHSFTMKQEELYKFEKAAEASK